MKESYNMLGLVGFIVSCASMLLNFFGLVGLAGTIMSIVGLVQINRDGGKGKGLAIAGICVGGVSTLIFLVSFLSVF